MTLIKIYYLTQILMICCFGSRSRGAIKNRKGVGQKKYSNFYTTNTFDIIVQPLFRNLTEHTCKVYRRHR